MQSVLKLLVASLIAAAFLPYARAASQQKTPSSSAAATTPQVPLVVPLFIDDGDFTSTLVLVNGGAVQTYADVTVRRQDGTTAATKRVQFAPHSQQQVALRALLDSAGAVGVTTGSVTVLQSSQLSGLVITAVLSMTRTSSSPANYIQEQITKPTGSGSSSLRAVADRGEGSPLVAITSLSNVTQHVQVQCLTKNGVESSKSVELSAGGTLLTGACSKRTENDDDFQSYMRDLTDESHGAIGISLISDATDGSFAAFALAPHGSAGNRYFSSMAFNDPKTIVSTTTVFTGVPVGSATLLPNGRYIPSVALANFSSQDRHVTIRYARTSGDSPDAQTLETVTLAPQSSKEISFDDLQGDPAMQNSFLVVADGSPGDVSAKLVARSDSELREVELLGKDLMDPLNGGNHPWTLENGTDSTLLLFNTSSAPQSFDVAITSGSTTWHKAYKLQPMQTKAIDIGALIENKVPDDSGNTLPSDAWSGQLDWYLANLNSGRGRLIQSNRQTAMARNFSCGVTIELCALGLTQYVTFVVDDQTVGFASINPQVCMNSCSGTPAGSGCTGCVYSWSSENSGIASISGSSSSTSVSLFGASAGTTWINASASGMSCYIQASPPPPATVQVPTADPIIATISNAARSGCQPYNGQPTSGWDRNTTKQVVDQNGNAIKLALQQMSESYVIGATNQLGIATIQTGTGSTDANGQFGDDYWVCSTACPASSGQTQATQHPKDTLPSGTAYNLNTNAVVYKCSNITVNGK
jgi:hypothetical protein